MRRNRMKRIGICIIIFILLFMTGCNEEESEIDKLIERVALSDLEEDVKDFINRKNIDNGIYMINTMDKQYLFLNSQSVVNGEEAAYFSNVYAEFSAETLKIYFEEHFVKDYSDDRLEDNMVIYLIHDDPRREYILPHKNGIEIPFDVIFGGI